jgi:putative endonuclease
LLLLLLLLLLSLLQLQLQLQLQLLLQLLLLLLLLSLSLLQLLLLLHLHLFSHLHLLLHLHLLFLLVILEGDLLFPSSPQISPPPRQHLLRSRPMPARAYHFWVYILSSRSRNLYIGMTNQLLTRTSQHKEHRPGTYTALYNIDRLVYFEYFQYVRSAIAREKELKRFTRVQKIELIERINPTWNDLFDTMTKPISPPPDTP